MELTMKLISALYGAPVSAMGGRLPRPRNKGSNVPTSSSLPSQPDMEASGCNVLCTAATSALKVASTYRSIASRTAPTPSRPDVILGALFRKVLLVVSSLEYESDHRLPHGSAGGRRLPDPLVLTCITQRTSSSGVCS